MTNQNVFPGVESTGKYDGIYHSDYKGLLCYISASFFYTVEIDFLT